VHDRDRDRHNGDSNERECERDRGEVAVFQAGAPRWPRPRPRCRAIGRSRTHSSETEFTFDSDPRPPDVQAVRDGRRGRELNPTAITRSEPDEARIGEVKSEAELPPPRPNPAIPGSLDAHLDAVDVALANALEAATADKQWKVVAQIAQSLDARRSARAAPNVVSIEARRREKQ
jgi:hypothetical protein